MIYHAKINYADGKADFFYFKSKGEGEDVFTFFNVLQYDSPAWYVYTDIRVLKRHIRSIKTTENGVVTQHTLNKFPNVQEY